MDEVEDLEKADTGSSTDLEAGAPGGTPDPIGILVEAIETEFRLAVGRPERVEEACARLRERIASPPGPADLALLARLAPPVAATRLPRLSSTRLAPGCRWSCTIGSAFPR